MTTETKNKDDIIFDAMNSAVLVIQNALGVDDGGFASMWFCGKHEDDLREILSAYYDAEKQNTESDRG